MTIWKNWPGNYMGRLWILRDVFLNTRQSVPVSDRLSADCNVQAKAIWLPWITSRPPRWIKPQLTRLVDEAPAGAGWLHEIKYDSYRMHARMKRACISSRPARNPPSAALRAVSRALLRPPLPRRHAAMCMHPGLLAHRLPLLRRIPIAVAPERPSPTSGHHHRL